MPSRPAEIHLLGPRDIARLRALNALFSDVFADPASYADAPPSDAYLADFLAQGHVIALIAVLDQRVIGGLVAYELRKFERERSEIYIYDLAVASDQRRQGVATALIEQLRSLAAGRGSYVIFVQADHSDPPAVALYTKLGLREDVLHFDIPVARTADSAG